MTLQVLFLFIPLLLLLAGAEALVRGSASLAMKAGISPLIIGLTVVAFGTSSPELMVSLHAAFTGQGDIAMGNVVGSNIFNIGVILGLTALICPIPVKLQLIKADVPVMILASCLLPVLARDGWVGQVEGSGLVAAAIIYTAANVVVSRRKVPAAVESEFAEGVPKATRSILLDILGIISGVLVLVIGARLLVDQSVALARNMGLSEAVIGLTIIAAGTSLPELATSVVAAIRKQPDLAIGNVVGSNIFNILGIIGVTSLARPIHGEGISTMDYGVMAGISMVLLPLLWSGVKLQRLEAVFLLACYGGYLYLIWPK